MDKVTESLDPVIAETNVASEAIQVQKGDARGVEQIAHGYINGVCKIKHAFLKRLSVSQNLLIK